MDRGFDLPATPVEIWPWLTQLGKNRAGWYFPRWVERIIPSDRRAPGHAGALVARGNLRSSWSIVVHPEGQASHVHLRFRIDGARRRRLVTTGSELLDLITVAGLAAGLRERVQRN